MRTARTFILRLLVDSDEPLALRGALRAVDAPEEHTFADAGRLLALLRTEAAATAAQRAALEAQPGISAIGNKEDQP